MNVKEVHEDGKMVLNERPEKRFRRYGAFLILWLFLILVGVPANAWADGWKTAPDGKKYYYAKGKPVIGRLIKIGSKKCYFDEDGNVQVKLLPALPSAAAWQSGHATGLAIKGGYTIDFEWTKGKVTNYTLHKGNYGLEENHLNFSMSSSRLSTPILE